jgi:membrane protease YdiL (CAAX protease family)
MKKKLGLFLILAFGIDWALWLATAAAAGPISEGAAVWNFVASVSMFGPLAAALAVRQIGGDDADRGWRPRLRGNARLYLAAWFVPATLAIAGAALYFLAVPSDFDGSASAYSQAAQAQLGVGPDQVSLVLAVQVASSIVLAPLFNMFLAIGEEAGWRGFLYPALQGFLSKPAAAVASGLIWGA